MRFELNMYTKSQRAERKGIKNLPNKKEIEKLKTLHKNVIVKIQKNLKAWLRKDLALSDSKFQKKYSFLNELERKRLKKNLRKIERFCKKHGVKPFVTSAFRSKALNAVTPGSSNKSQHTKAEAVDFEILGVCNWSLWNILRANLKYDQLILEFHKDGDDQSGWIHCSFVKHRKNRNWAFRLPKR